MPYRFLLIVSACFVALAACNGGSSTLNKQLSDFAVEDTAAVTKIFLADKAGTTILLERTGPQQWRLNDKYEARQSAIVMLLSTMRRVSIKAPVSKVAFENVVKQIAASSVKVEVYQGDEEPSKVYFVGGPNKSHSGSYMLMEGSSVPFLVHIEGFHGFLTPRYFTNENEWRNNIICHYDYGDIATIKAEFMENPQNSFMITDLGDGTFSLKSLALEKEITDYEDLAVKGYLTGFKHVPFEHFEETKDQAFIDSVINSTPMEIYTITDKAGEVTEIKTFLKPIKSGAVDMDDKPIDHDLDRLYALVNNELFVIIQYFIFDKFNMPVTSFLKRKQ